MRVVVQRNRHEFDGRYSAIIPFSFADIGYLQLAIESVRLQTIQPQSIIVVDNIGRLGNRAFGDDVAVYRPVYNLGYMGALHHLWSKNPMSFLVMNDDLALLPTFVEQVSKYPEPIKSGYGFAAFIASANCFYDIPKFDSWYWPTFYEDTDWMAMIRNHVMDDGSPIFTYRTELVMRPFQESRSKDGHAHFSTRWNRLHFQRKWGTGHDFNNFSPKWDLPYNGELFCPVTNMVKNYIDPYFRSHVKELTKAVSSPLTEPPEPFDLLCYAYAANHCSQSLRLDFRRPSYEYDLWVHLASMITIVRSTEYNQ